MLMFQAIEERPRRTIVSEIGIVHKSVGASDVVRVGGAVRRDPAGRDDGEGFVDLELGALDEVREVRLEERRPRRIR